MSAKTVALAFVVLAGFSGPAFGQTARCGMELGQWVCRADNSPDYSKAWGNPIAAQAQGYDYATALAAQRRASALAQEVGALVAAGQCDQAVGDAVSGNNLALAETARRTCVAKP